LWRINQAAQMLPYGAGIVQNCPPNGRPSHQADGKNPQVKQGFVEGSNGNACSLNDRLSDIQRAMKTRVS